MFCLNWNICHKDKSWLFLCHALVNHDYKEQDDWRYTYIIGLNLMSHQIHQEQHLMQWTKLSNDLACNLNLSQ
jgi:hypothetical protein